MNGGERTRLHNEYLTASRSIATRTRGLNSKSVRHELRGRANKTRLREQEGRSCIVVFLSCLFVHVRLEVKGGFIPPQGNRMKIVAKMENIEKQVSFSGYFSMYTFCLPMLQSFLQKNSSTDLTD